MATSIPAPKGFSQSFFDSEILTSTAERHTLEATPHNLRRLARAYRIVEKQYIAPANGISIRPSRHFDRTRDFLVPSMTRARDYCVTLFSPATRVPRLTDLMCTCRDYRDGNQCKHTLALLLIQEFEHDMNLWIDGDLDSTEPV